jgi:hypothetical protein
MEWGRDRAGGMFPHEGELMQAWLTFATANTRCALLLAAPLYVQLLWHSFADDGCCGHAAEHTWWHVQCGMCGSMHGHCSAPHLQCPEP